LKNIADKQYVKNLGIFFLGTFYLAVWPIISYAWPPTFGPEFTFTNQTLIRNGDPKTRKCPECANARDRMARIMSQICKTRGDCVVIPSRDDIPSLRRYRVQYKDGWYFDISVDPLVVEIQAKPNTRLELEFLQPRIEEDIFRVAELAGLYPHKDYGGGHIHIGSTSGFGDDALLFRNFLVDFTNHPDLALDILDKNIANAPPISSLSTKQKAAFKGVIAAFDRGEIKTIQQLARAIFYTVYIDSPILKEAPYKYQALNVTRIATNDFLPEMRTLEIRPIRAQRSAKEYLDLVRLFEARLVYLKRLGKPVPYLEKEPSRSLEEQVRTFYRYVTESGLSWDEYRKLLPSELQEFSYVVSGSKPQRGGCLQRLLSLLGR